MFIDSVYPKYFITDPVRCFDSGFILQNDHDETGFGTFGEILHGIIGIKKEVIIPDNRAVPDTINFFLNFM